MLQSMSANLLVTQELTFSTVLNTKCTLGFPSFVGSSEMASKSFARWLIRMWIGFLDSRVHGELGGPRIWDVEGCNRPATLINRDFTANRVDRPLAARQMKGRLLADLSGVRC